MRLPIGRAMVTAALLTVLLATPSFAQGGRRPGGQGGPGGPGGFGGRGMGMMGGMMGGGDTMLLGLLRVEAVQKELDMMPDQVEAVGKVSESMRNNRGQGRINFPSRDASEEEMEKFREDMRKQMEERSKEVTENLEQILFPEQLERGRQIVLQQQGPGALMSPEVAKKLEITEAQKTKLEEVQQKSRESMGEEMRELFQSRDREAIQKKMTELQDKLKEDMLAVLTSSQQEEFNKMLGKPFEMPEGAMGGFGGRGPGGPGGGRGGRGGGRGPGGRGGNDA